MADFSNKIKPQNETKENIDINSPSYQSERLWEKYYVISENFTLKISLLRKDGQLQ